MSDFSQGPGWWQASDGKWYPPEQAPGGQATPPPGTPPAYGTPDPGAYGAPPGYGAAPGYGAPAAGGQPSVGEAFSYGWAKFQQYVGPILIGLIGYFIVSGILFFIILGISNAFDSFIIAQFLLNLGVYLVMFLVQMAIIRAALQICDGRPLEVGAMFATDQLGPYVLASILVALGTAIGALLCIIPGIIFAFFAGYFGYFVLDRQQGPTDAIKSSFDLVKDNVGLLIVFYLASLLAYLVGAALCGLGLLVAFPVVTIGQTYLYRRLSGGAVAA